MEFGLAFGAVGDFIAVSLLIKDIISSLDDCRGSAKQYQELVHSLRILDDALREVDQVLRDPQRMRANKTTGICSAALDSVRQINELLKSFNSKLQKYRSSLRDCGSGNPLKDATRKVQFMLGEKEFERVKDEITRHTITLKMLLEIMTLHIVEHNHEAVMQKLASIHNQSHQATKELETRSRSLQDTAWNLGRRVIGKVTFLTQATLDIKKSVSQIASMVLSVSREVASFRVLLTTLERPITDEYFTLEDALGRIYPIHLRTITSWDAFDFVLSEKFKGEKGAHRVRHGRYELLDYATRREIEQDANWGRTFLPRQKIAMSLFCKESGISAPNATRPTSCPRCMHPSSCGSSTQVQCQNCNMFYTRVVELDDAAQPSLTAEFPERMKRNFDSYKFDDGGPHSSARKTKRTKREASSRRRAPDHRVSNDYGSDDEDVSGLVRVTIVSRLQKIELPHERIQYDSLSRQTKRPLAVEEYFACPFAKRDPSKYNWCLPISLRRINDVKQHLKRRHGPSESSLEGGITAAQAERLFKRYSKRLLQKEQWYHIFKILFPEDQYPSSPFIVTRTWADIHPTEDDTLPFLLG